MVKFLKFILFVVVMAFSFALGVRFSDSFKNNLGSFKDDEIKVEAEMNKAFDSIGNKEREVIDDSEGDVEITQLTDEEKSEVMNQSKTVPEYVDMEIVEPMDGVAPMSDDSIADSNVQQQIPADSEIQLEEVLPAKLDMVEDLPTQQSSVDIKAPTIEYTNTSVEEKPLDNQQGPTALPTQQGQAITE